MASSATSTVPGDTPSFILAGCHRAVPGVIGPLLVLFELARGRYVLYELWLAALTCAAGDPALVHCGPRARHGWPQARRRRVTSRRSTYFGLPAAFVDPRHLDGATQPAITDRVRRSVDRPVLGGAAAVAAFWCDQSARRVSVTRLRVRSRQSVQLQSLLELDGYYMLIDFLDRPLLRAGLAFVRGPLWSR